MMPLLVDKHKQGAVSAIIESLVTKIPTLTVQLIEYPTVLLSTRMSSLKAIQECKEHFIGHGYEESNGRLSTVLHKYYDDAAVAVNVSFKTNSDEVVIGVNY